ncbi:DUF971 domain-containing protein [Deltaproteobacteria bacterium TL4]
MTHAVKRRKPEKILIGEDLYLLWKDGHESHLNLFELRDACPCAHCVDELSGEKKLDSSSIPRDIHVVSSRYVGNYALYLRWSDNHDAGIYPFKKLRELCHCLLCQPNRAP